MSWACVYLSTAWIQAQGLFSPVRNGAFRLGFLGGLIQEPAGPCRYGALFRSSCFLPCALFVVGDSDVNVGVVLLVLSHRRTVCQRARRSSIHIVVDRFVCVVHCFVMPKKQSGNLAASRAGRLLRLVGRRGPSTVVLLTRQDGVITQRNITSLVRSLAASVLSQDETKGRRNGK